LKEIRVQTGYDFFFEENTLSKYKTVTYHINKRSLEDVLDAIFKEQPFTYSISQKTVVIKNRDNVPLLKKLVSMAETKIAGTVRDSLGEPLIGVSVKVKGTS